MITVARYEIVESERCHIDAMVKAMREEDAAEAVAMGLRPRAALGRSFRKGIMRRTAFIDGDIAAMWGLCGTLLSNEGTPWLVTTKAVERLPIAFIKEGRREVAAMLSIRPILSNIVPASYGRAVELLHMLGFMIGKPEPYGPDNVLFRSFSMRS